MRAELRSLVPLPWDSEFFGARIARLDPGSLTEDVLEESEAEARELGVQCLYLDLLPDEAAALPVDRLPGLRLVDVRMNLVRSTAVALVLRPGASVTVRVGSPVNVTRLTKAVEALVPWSRYAQDPRFGPAAARQMYGAWLRRAASAPDELFAVAERMGRPVGFVTATLEPEPRIGLLSVGEPGQMQGTGPSLVATAVDWGSPSGARLFANTQARNVRALGFYQRCGFEVDECRYLYHWWLQ
jgi:dTDP-4-amino-4,6-dideoxy-D-galactose acyltransferase